jgi:hypothetical protein
VQGLAKILDIQWLDEPHDDYGNASSEAWEQRKIAVGGGQAQPGLELRAHAWESENVSPNTMRNRAT